MNTGQHNHPGPRLPFRTRYNPVVLPDGGAGNPERGSQEASFPLDLVTPQLEKVLSSEAFVHSPQLCRFLRFIVEQEIAGQSDQLKEYVLGLQVLRKDESFDPRIDTAVRSEARRLRQKLARMERRLHDLSHDVAELDESEPRSGVR